MDFVLDLTENQWKTKSNHKKLHNHHGFIYSLATVMRKLYNWFISTSKNEKIILLLQVFFVPFIVVACINVDYALYILKRGGYRLPVATALLLLVVYAQEIYASIHIPKIRRKFPKKVTYGIVDDLIDGSIRADALLDFIYTECGRPTTKAVKHFGINAEKASRIGKNLDRMGITRKGGADNARVLCDVPLRYVEGIVRSHSSSDRWGVYTDSGVEYMALCT